MFPRPVATLTPNTYEFEVTPLVKPTGFREYDARWWFGIPGSPQPPELKVIVEQYLADFGPTVL